jgi:hypothetical protein
VLILLEGLSSSLSSPSLHIPKVYENRSKGKGNFKRVTDGSISVGVNCHCKDNRMKRRQDSEACLNDSDDDGDDNDIDAI